MSKSIIDNSLHDDSTSRVIGSHRLVACNYAPRSDNAIHQDAFAKQYGFTGGLVPGVGVYALMTYPFAKGLGEAWLDAGWMQAKFIHPVYDGEEVDIRCESAGAEVAGEIRIEVHNSRGKLCAVGAGGMRAPDAKPPRLDQYERLPLPRDADRFMPEAARLPSGAAIGSLPVRPDAEIDEDRYFEELRDTLVIYREGRGRFHPAFLPHIANRIVHRNIAVGPWIHTESRVVHFAPARPDAALEMRGRIRDSFRKRGHEYVLLDLAVFDGNGEPIAHIDHTAIVRPHLEESSA